MLGGRQPCLVVVRGRTQARAFGPNVGELRKPVAANLALNAEVPLLGCADNPVQRNHEFDRALNRPGKTGRALLDHRKGARTEARKKRGYWNEGLRWGCSEKRNGKRAVGCKQVGQTACPRQEAHLERKGGRGNREVICRAQVFAHGVNTIPGTNRSGVMAAYVVGKADAWFPDSRVFVLETSLIQRPCNATQIELVHALGINERLPCYRCQKRVGVAGMAKQVVRGADKFISEAEVQG